MSFGICPTGIPKRASRTCGEGMRIHYGLECGLRRRAQFYRRSCSAYWSRTWRIPSWIRTRFLRWSVRLASTSASVSCPNVRTADWGVSPVSCDRAGAVSAGCEMSSGTTFHTLASERKPLRFSRASPAGSRG